MSFTSPSVLPVPSRRFGEIDALRAVACGLVLWSHAVGTFHGVADSKQWLSGWKHIGWFGVLIFFAISGFVIPSSLRGERWTGVRRFVIRRFWRLYPPFWCAVLISWLIDPWEKTIRSIPWRASMLPAQNWDELGIAAHFWTLQVELIFYIMVSSLFLAFGRLGLRILIPTYLGVSIILWIWVCFEWPYLMPENSFWLGLPVYLAVMFWGACCRELINVQPFGCDRFVLFRNRRAIGIGLVTGISAMIPLNVSFLGWAEGNTLMLSQGLTTFGGLIIFLFCAILTPVKVGWVADLGRWTYSTYLFHIAVLYFVLRAINSKVLTDFSTVLRGWPLPVYAIVLIVLCFVVGAVGYRWTEQPSDRVGKLWTAKKSRSV